MLAILRLRYKFKNLFLIEQKIYHSVIPSEQSERGNAAIKSRAEGACTLCRDGAVKTKGQSPLYSLMKNRKIATAFSKPRNDFFD